MALNQVSNPFALLGQAPPPAVPVRLEAGGLPNLEIAWGSFHQGMGSSVRAILSRSAAGAKFSIDGFFKECWVERRVPARAIAAAALWHVVFLVMPFPRFPATTRHFAAFENAELTWSGPINDLPFVDLKSTKAKPSPRGEPERALPPEGADAFHPRQHIFTDAARPTHPRQTLINSAGPLEAPKILPNLPNIVEIQEFAGPAKPRLQISEEAVGKLRPKSRPAATVTVTAAPLAELPTFDEQAGEISVVSSNTPARPKLELNAGAAPRLAPKIQKGDTGPAPEMDTPTPNSAVSNSTTLMAISAAPAPPAPVVQVPSGNLAARVSISPEGKTAGAPGAAGGGGGGTGSSSGGAGIANVDVSIKGGSPTKNRVVTGLGASGGISPLPSHGPFRRPESDALVDDVPERAGPPNFAALPAGAPPEQIFASKKVYKLLVNMPNLNSATGSWILNFSEMRVNSDAPRATGGDLSGPSPLRKVDPKYPPTLRNEHVEGEVVLYAVIRRDGSVDSIQLVHGIDDLLDANAMQALSQWKFRPATREGTPVELEAVVHIPFHAPDLR